VLGQVRRTQRYASILSDDETVLVAHVVSLATEYGRYGYRHILTLGVDTLGGARQIVYLLVLVCVTAAFAIRSLFIAL
jgi:hypothetical protein